MNNAHELLIVTGMSGAGRSTVGNALEDLGWYVVDNLPPQLLNPISDLFSLAKSPLFHVAVIIDVRGREFFEELLENLNLIRNRDISIRVLFLEANDSALVKRFENVRRPHPLQADGTILDGITLERNALLTIRENADVVIDTSDQNIHQLSNRIADDFSLESSSGLRLNLMSFGFKYGIPADADMVADARFIPNPFWDERLRSSTGVDEEVAAFVLSQQGVPEFVEHYVAVLTQVIQGYLRENKRYATVAIGCTGGKHRSVALVSEIAKRIADLPNLQLSVKHRDLGRE